MEMDPIVQGISSATKTYHDVPVDAAYDFLRDGFHPIEKDFVHVGSSTTSDVFLQSLGDLEYSSD
jgi:hypothetical protein